MKGFDRFQNAMIEAAQRHLKPAMEEHREALAETIKNDLFDLDGPRQLDRQLSARDQFFGKAFRGFLEISKSLETLEDIAFYIGRFPFHRTRITRERYLQFHVESYFSEVYILRERLKRYVTLLERQYRRDPRISNVQDRCKVLTDSITQSLEGVIDVRRRHVHEVRFSDDGIDRLATIALLSRGSNDELTNLMKEFYREEHMRVKKIWVDQAKANNRAIRQLLDVFFDTLFPVAFDENTTALRYPKEARN
jgi:RNase P/RNase MRP subunit POP5